MEKAIVITAPSGAGKSTIATYILESVENLGFSVSATTRPPREGEIDGVDYYFIDKEEFLARITRNEFVEWEEVYRGIYYGTLKSEIERIWKTGAAVLYVVDVVGAKDLKRYFGDKALSVFIEPPSIEVLRERLLKRGSETDLTMERRLARAVKEMEEKNAFDLIIMNDDLEKAKADALSAIQIFLSGEKA